MQAPPSDTPTPSDPPRPQAPPPSPSLPARRWAVGLLSMLHAVVFAWAAIELPFRRWTIFTIVTFALAALHSATAALSLIPRALAPRAFRVTSLCSLAYLGYLSFALASSAAYIAALNRGLGTGIAAGLLTVWAVLALFTLPFACWGVASTGGIHPRRGTGVALAALVASAALGIAWQHRVAQPDAMPVPGGDPAQTKAALRDALASFAALPAPPPAAPSLFTTAPAACAAPPEPGRATIVITHLARKDDAGGVAATSRCVQPSPGEDPKAALLAAVATGLRGPIKIDVLSAVQPLGAPGPGLTGLSMRPGLDGICLRDRCLMPWQLIALDAFTANAPLHGVPDFRLGVDLGGLRRALGEPPGDERPATLDVEALRSGLLRIETLSYVVDDKGSLHALSRIGQPARALTDGTLAEAARTAQGYIQRAQREDGMFSYVVDPFAGSASFRGFAAARQAGTTLALCELGPSARDESATAKEALKTTIQRSLALLATLERAAGSGGSVGAIVYPTDSRDTLASLTPTALSLSAFLACREIAGPGHDALIGRLARMVLATQREDGGFAPQLDLTRTSPVLGPGQLYEGGQSVLALTLLEALSAREPRAEFPPHATLRAAVDRAMEFYATRYWDHFMKDFFYIEENWHCLAARAALGHHRVDAYERFCIDYVTFKARLVLTDESRVQPDFVGGYGFGNILPPHNTATAGFGEALAAAMAVKEARGDDLSKDRALMEKVLGFLVRQQWAGPNCFACSHDVTIEGGFSESMASPRVRIDYVQHAWAALGHGGRMLGLLPRPGAPKAVPL
jgi:hypothetical protein